MRSFGVDVHRDFCEVAVVEEGRVGSLGRIETSAGSIREFAADLGGGDRVAFEAGCAAMILAGCCARPASGGCSVQRGGDARDHSRACRDGSFRRGDAGEALGERDAQSGVGA